MRGKSQFCDVLTTHHAPPSQKRGTSHRFGACVGAVRVQDTGLDNLYANFAIRGQSHQSTTPPFD
jgi:hypothetical protein